jgi:PAS domain-containing protein
VEYQLKQKDGSPVWCSLSGKAIDPSSPPDLNKGVLWIIDDITERKRAEKALTEAKEHLDLALSSAKMGSWNYLVPEDRLEFDEAKGRLYGIEPGDFGGTFEAWLAFIHPEDVEKVVANVQAVMKSGDRYKDEYRIIRPNGDLRYLVTQGVFFFDSEGQPVRATGLTWDNTERKQAEEELRQNMEELERFSKLAVGREERMINLKEEINELLGEIGKSPKYKIVK